MSGRVQPSVRVIHGDCLTVMRRMEADAFEASVTDPPYDLSFMGKSWDSTGVAFDPTTWREALRVLKPGGHLLAFGGARTFHRLTCAIEDAGFEVRDCLCWLYGSGFPKSLDVSKAIDKAAGAEREVVGTKAVSCGTGDAFGKAVGDRGAATVVPVTRAATDAARRWEGWGTALKPGWEPIILARKPLSGPNVAANVQRWGTGALNVDGCRIPTGGESLAGGGVSSSAEGWDRPWKHSETAVRAAQERSAAAVAHAESLGRWPANVALDEEAAAMLDAQTGDRPSGSTHVLRRGATTGVGMGYGSSAAGDFLEATYGDSGGASRFFYCAKADRAERDAGLGGMPERLLHWSSGDASPGSFQSDGTHKAARNDHPTVKPVDLMRWLCRLVTPPGGTILDPFAGSGSTLVAAAMEGFNAIGIEQDEHYCEIARKRVFAAAQPRMDLEAVRQ